MDRLVIFARLYVALIGGFGFIFGQIFFSTFSLLSSVIGLSALAGAALSSPSKGTRFRYLAVILCVVAMVGLALDAVGYYRDIHIPGNSYGWEIIGPLVVALAFLVFSNVAPRLAKSAVASGDQGVGN
jgi:hypothetical protein